MNGCTAIGGGDVGLGSGQGQAHGEGVQLLAANEPTATTAAIHDQDVLTRIICTRRSVRRFDGRPLPRPRIRELVELATRAPSNLNSQPWRFVVFDREGPRRRLLGAFDELFEQMKRADAGLELFHVLDHIGAWLDPLRQSPVIVLAFYRRNPESISRGLAQIPGSGKVLDYNPNLLSLGMAIENLLLAAHAVGLGACALAGPVPFLRGTIKGLLRLPDQLELAAVVSIGHPNEAPPAPPHRDLARSLSFVDDLDGDVRLSP
jgi:nitroreductase